MANLRTIFDTTYLHAISLLVLMLFFCCIQREQNDFSDLKAAYLGQRPPRMTPEVFAPGILSHGLHEHALTISPNDSELFYATTDSSFSYYTIVRVVKENNLWKKPEVVPFSGEYLDLAPSFAPDGTKLFYSSSRPVLGSHKKKVRYRHLGSRKRGRFLVKLEAPPGTSKYTGQ